MTISTPAATPSARINTTRVVRNRARVERVRRLTHDTFELVVRCDPQDPPLLARAGQFATLKVAGLSRPRAYSFARDPRGEVAGQFTFIIRQVSAGEMSRWLERGNHSGERIEIAGPLGRFVLDKSSAPMLLVGGGSGMSATRALLEAAARDQQPRDCLFLYGARERADLYAEADIRSIAASWHPAHRCEFVQVLSAEPADSDWSGPRGLVTDYLRSVVTDADARPPAGLRAWLCGPPPMIETAAAVLESVGVARENIMRDVFEDARDPAPVIDNRRCVLCDECLLVRPVEGCIVETGDLRVDNRGERISATLLAPGRTAGLYYNALVVDATRCIRCSACVNACPHDAIAPRFSTGATLRGTRSV